MKKILAIETSCDDTSISILEGIEVISIKTFSQIEEHAKYGGVIPEMASRLHSKYIFEVIKSCVKDSGITLQDIDAIAVTSGPGLVNTLQVGMTVAKTLSLKLDVPLYEVNHIEGHMYSPFIGKEQVQIPNKAIVLIASGGHTEILLKDGWKVKLLGKTRDDSIGEAYDKVAKALGEAYPGGPVLDKIASSVEETNIKAPVTRLEGYEFSYSGLKSFMVKMSKDKKAPKNELIHAFQNAAVEQIYLKIEKAVEEFGIKNIIVGGGVSANSLLREKISSHKDWDVFLPKLMYTGDNAAMIGYVAAIKIEAGKLKPSKLDIDAKPREEIYG